MIRFWRPATEGKHGQWWLVACVASTDSLWAILDGPGPARIPQHPLEPQPPEPLWGVTITLPSGLKLPFIGATSNSTRKRSQCMARFDSPPEPSEPLTLQWIEEDDPGSDHWVVIFDPLK